MTQRMSIFITGAAKGIGAEMARLFSSKGWIVGITDINQNDLDALRSELGQEHFYRQLDVTVSEQVESALAEFSALNGGAIDVVVNNAGIAFIDDFEKLSLQKHLAVTEVNVKGVQIGSFHALPYLKKSKHPVLVNMCSLSSEYGVPSEASYSASKFWVKGFTEALNIEWERHGIYVCSVMPNFVATPMMDAAHGPIVDSVGIHLTPADVAKTVWRAVQRQGKVHWEVDTWRPILMRSIGKLLPATLRRTMIKRVSGY
jgi:NAD(P)-dependent dehydrogenase (short-subunit alcohol dehydrogenase family)